MMHNTRTDDLALFFELSDEPAPSQRIDTPLKIMVPAFIVSELKTAFIMGFCIYIPFLLIDLVVSTILMALGMMMMPPVVVSTPCKLLLFILVDGWQLITRALVSSFSVV
jgi:flagellar biosynthetic protein FliP